jgi:hypothetical protein
MPRRRFYTLLIACIFCCSSALYPNIFPADTAKATKQDSTKKADSSKKKEWDVTAAHGSTSDVEFTTTEGTWMNLDVSPEGKEIVFDLLGDIYIMPITGGAAKLLNGGPAFEVQPRFSPDGRYVYFSEDMSPGPTFQYNKDPKRKWWPPAKWLARGSIRRARFFTARTAISKR